MHLEFPESAHTETLVAVVLGALLATVSGVIANQWEAYLRRRERERSAALLFGEVLSTLRVLLESADRVRRIPPAFGPVTRRMLRSARREIDIYERNRESLVDLSDPALRADIHRTAVQIAMALDGILDFLDRPNDEDEESRDRGFVFMMEAGGRIPDIARRLGKLARHDFSQFDTVPGPDGTPMPRSAAARAINSRA